jgi:hypothetical protein
MFRNFLTPELSRRGIHFSTIWFHQDGASAPTARASMEVMREMFPEHVIVLRGELSWPARSPVLSASAYFLWGYLKAKVYTSHISRPPLDDGPSMTSRRQFGSRFQRYHKTWRSEQRETCEACEPGWKSAYVMMVNILRMRCSKRNKQT